MPDRAKELPSKIVEEFGHVDLIIHAGDITTKAVLEKLKGLAEVKAVHGNMDTVEIAGILPRKEILKCGKFTFGIFHGSGNPAFILEQLQKEFKDDKVDIIIFGHSHKAMNEKIGKVLFFNPGSPTDKFFAPFNSFGIIELNDKINAKIIKLES
jgi:hypothetical protein